MQRKFFLGCVGLIGSAAACWAQVQRPVLGYMPEGGSIRTIYGLPASGAIGPAAALARDLAHAAVAPDGSFAVAVTADGGQPVVVAVGGSAMQVDTVQGTLGGADRVVLSPRGSAALVGNSSGAFQVITGLPSAGVVKLKLDSSIIGAAAAIGDDGQWVVSTTAGGVTAYGRGGESIPIPISGAVTAVAFLQGKQDIVVTTASEVTMIADIAGAANRTTLFAPPPGTPAPSESPIAVAMSADNNHLVLVEPSGGIGHINLTTGAVTVVDCQCAPEGLFSLGGAVFRLTGINGGAAQVFDASSDSVWFVPLALEAAAGGAQ